VPILRISDFSGGLNLRDSPQELAPTETPDSLNWTLDQRGALKWRKGCQDQIALPGNTQAAAFCSIAPRSISGFVHGPPAEPR
jgi:hypothetical protein